MADIPEDVKRWTAKRRWLAFDNEQHPHQSLGYLSPSGFREQPLRAA